MTGLETKSQEIEKVHLEQFKEILEKIVDPTKSLPQITLKSRLREDLDLDDLEVYEFLYRIEETYKISISSEKANRFTSLGDYSNYLKKI